MQLNQKNPMEPFGGLETEWCFSMIACRKRMFLSSCKQTSPLHL